MTKKENRAEDFGTLESTEVAEAAAMSKTNRRHKRRLKLFGGAAALVVFVTTYMLILPAITLTGTPTCGIEEHTHTDSCYTEEQVLTCGQAESEGHTHTEACYDADGNLICGMQETSGHTHTADCYTTERVLTCTLPEHVHSSNCYSQTDEDADQDADEGADKSSASDAESSNEEDEELPVGDSTADVESAADWEATFAGVTLTGDWGADTIAIAKTQIGYCESTENFISYKDENDEVVKKGYSRYAAWYHNGESSYGDWCAMFCSFCYHYAEVPESAMPEHSGVPAWITLLNSSGQYHGAVSTDYVPKTGDLIFYDWEQDGVSDHVALVEKCEDGVIYTIEGNVSDMVTECVYNYGDYRIMGYGELPVNPDYEEPVETFSLTATADDGTVIHLTGDSDALPYPADEITVTAVTSENADAEQLVESITDGDELPEYKAYTYDITLWHGDEVIEPTGPVTMTIEGIHVSAGAEAHVFHTETDQGGTQEIASETAEDGSITVQTDGFSQYSVIIVYNGDEFELTAETEDGVTIRVSGPISALPDDPENITLTAEKLEPVYTEEYDENGELVSAEEEASDYSKAAALVEEQLGPNVVTDEDGNEQTYEWVHNIYDISLWNGDEEIEPDGTVTLTIEGLDVEPEEENHLVHIDEEQTTAEELPAEYSEDGTITVETDHFSSYDSSTNTYRINSASDWTTANLNGRNVRVTADLSGITTTAQISGTTSINLNGHTLSYTGSSRLIEVVSGGNLTITDSKATEATETVDSGNKYDRTATYSNKALTYYVTKPVANGDGTTTETVYKYTVTGVGLITSTNSGISVIKVTDGTLNLNSGMIAGCTTHAIYQTGGTMNLNGGYVCGNTCAETGGGITIEGGTATLSGTVVAANEATNGSGGGIVVKGATLTIEDGGIVTGNTTSGNGGGIYVDGGTVVMNGGYITNNHMNGQGWYARGGGICLSGGSFTMNNSAAITGNYSYAGGGGLGALINTNSQFTINNGFVSSNYADHSEGGGIGVMGTTTGYIYGGYITNNICATTTDWGGGGMFVSENATVFVPNVVITNNGAGGFGGGLAACSTGIIYVDDDADRGGAIYGNRAAGTNLSGSTSAKNADHTYAANSPVFMANGYQDYFCAHASKISGGMLSGSETLGLENWSGSADGVPISSVGSTEYLSCTNVMGLTAAPSEADILAANAHANVYITGNYSNTHGGGVLTNGYLQIGYSTEEVVPEAVALTATKQLLKQNGEKGELKADEFTFYITDANWDIISTGTNDASGNITFNNAIPFDEAGEFTFYIYEADPSTENGIVYDTNQYRLTVTTKKDKLNTITNIDGSTLTRYKINLTKAVIDVRNGEDGTWTNVRTVTSFTNDALHTENLKLTTDTTFQNYEADNVNLSVTKVWADGTPGYSSVTVYLKRNGETFTADGIETTVTLSAANSWTYSWTDLPSTGTDSSGNKVSYSYTVEEAALSNYVSVVTYTNESSVDSYWVPVKSGETLVTGTEYAILTYDNTKELYVSDSTKDTRIYPGTSLRTISASKNSGSITINGTSYSNYYSGDAFSDDSIFLRSDYSNSDGTVTGITLKNKAYNSWLANQYNAELKTTTGQQYASRVTLAYTSGKMRIQLEQKIINDGGSGTYRYINVGDSDYTMSTSLSHSLQIYKKVYDTATLSTDAVITNTKTESLTYKLYITKTNTPAEGETPIVLRNAEFNLLDESGTAMKFTLGADGYYTPDSNGNTTIMVTDGSGSIKVRELPGGTYTLRETKAPSGYDVAGDQTVTLNEQTKEFTFSITVEDPPYNEDYSLPVTGGTGTRLFTLGGIMLMLGALVIGFGSRRRRERGAAR